MRKTKKDRTTTKMHHTSWPWEVDFIDKFCPGAYRLLNDIPHGEPGDRFDEANLRLIEAAPTAPHECADPLCPGASNKRKLEAFDKMLEALKAAKSLITTARGYFPKSIRNPDSFTLEHINASVCTAIYEAERTEE